MLIPVRKFEFMNLINWKTYKYLPVGRSCMFTSQG